MRLTRTLTIWYNVMVTVSAIYPRAGFVEICFEGEAERGFPNLVSHLQVIVDACHTHQCNYALCDYSAIDYHISSDILGEHLFAEGLQNTPFVKLAIIPPAATTAEQLPPHLENAARNRGVNLLFFLNRDEAVAWLLKNQ